MKSKELKDGNESLAALRVCQPGKKSQTGSPDPLVQSLSVLMRRFDNDDILGPGQDILASNDAVDIGKRLKDTQERFEKHIAKNNDKIRRLLEKAKAIGYPSNGAERALVKEIGALIGDNDKRGAPRVR